MLMLYDLLSRTFDAMLAPKSLARTAFSEDYQELLTSLLTSRTSHIAFNSAQHIKAAPFGEASNKIQATAHTRFQGCINIGLGFFSRQTHSVFKGNP
ncbi:MAG: hypothetical protein ACUVRP_08230 [Chlorobiales bacterium]